MANNFLGGNKQTSNSRFLSLLRANRNLNTGTHTGGLAHVLNEAAQGYASGVDRNQEAASNEAMSKAAALMQGTNPQVFAAPSVASNLGDDEGAPLGPEVTIPGVAPDMQGAIGVLGADPKFGPLAMQLQMGLNAKNEAATLVAQKLANKKAMHDYKVANPLTNSTGPSSPEKNFDRLMALRKLYPQTVGKDGKMIDHPIVNDFKSFARANQKQDMGGFVRFVSGVGGPGTGEVDVRKTLRPGEEPKVKQAQSKAAAAGTEAIKQVGVAFEGLNKVRINIGNLRAAIGAIDDGAQSGPVYKLLPSVSAASIELDNIRNQLGLDVVGAVTFGALSKGELDLAKDTALPIGLKPQQLRAWLVKKSAAQEKLSAYYSKAAIYLGKPGNTVSSWVEVQEAARAARASGAPPAAPPSTTPVSPKDAEAFEWLKKNPDDPRAPAIRKKLGL